MRYNFSGVVITRGRHVRLPGYQQNFDFLVRAGSRSKSSNLVTSGNR